MHFEIFLHFIIFIIFTIISELIAPMIVDKSFVKLLIIYIIISTYKNIHKYV